MKLIDADALKEYCIRASKSDDDFRRVSLATLASVIDVQPTAYDADKVVEQLKERSKEYNSGVRLHGKPEEIRIDEAIEIVKGGGVNEMEE
jgi:hypothetical protein